MIDRFESALDAHHLRVLGVHLVLDASVLQSGRVSLQIDKEIRFGMKDSDGTRPTGKEKE